MRVVRENIFGTTIVCPVGHQSLFEYSNIYTNIEGQFTVCAIKVIHGEQTNWICLRFCFCFEYHSVVRILQLFALSMHSSRVPTAELVFNIHSSACSSGTIWYAQ